MSAASTLGVPTRAQSRPVHLLVVRERGYETKCVPCVAGRLFGVPSGIDLASAELVLGLLTFIADTIELSYEPESGRPSSIPEATYNARIRNDATKRWMWSGGKVADGSILLDRSWRLELMDVPRRTAIQFHFGRDVNWSLGCIILGHRPSACPARGPCTFPNSPEAAVRALRNYVESNAISSDTSIRVRFASA